jgi:hypothetical protein
MKRKIITNNETRTIKKKPKTTEQLKKAVEKLAVPPKFFPGTPISPGQALGDYIQKSAAEQNDKFRKDLLGAYFAGQKSAIPSSPYLGGQAIATSDYKAWKPGNVPTADEIKAMLQLLGGNDPSKNMPSELFADEDTAKQLKALAGTKLDKLGVKVHVVPGTKPGTVIGVDMAKVGADFTAMLMPDWPVEFMMPEQYKSPKYKPEEKK